MTETHESGTTQRRFLRAIGVAERDVTDVLADPWCQQATGQLLAIVRRIADDLDALVREAR